MSFSDMWKKVLWSDETKSEPLRTTCLNQTPENIIPKARWQKHHAVGWFSVATAGRLLSVERKRDGAKSIMKKKILSLSEISEWYRSPAKIQISFSLRISSLMWRLLNLKQLEQFNHEVVRCAKLVETYLKSLAAETDARSNNTMDWCWRVSIAVLCSGAAQNSELH